MVVGAIYNFDDLNPNLSAIYQALAICIEQHPILTAIIKNPESERAFYERVPFLNLAEHVLHCQKHDTELAEDDLIENVLPSMLDHKWRKDIPRWKLFIEPILDNQWLMSFAFCHSIGDGMSGIAFHRSFLNALEATESPVSTKTVVQSSTGLLAAAFDTKERLPVSWPYLLTPLLAVYVSNPVAISLGLRAAASTVDHGTWTGSNMFYTKDHFRTGVKIMSFEAALLRKILDIAKFHNTKLTAVIHGLIIKAMSRHVSSEAVTTTNLVSQTAVNMRGSVNASNDQMGLFVSGFYDIHPLDVEPSPLATNASFWSAASTMTRDLSLCVGSLQDHPIGLLQYLPNVRSWTLSKPGLSRDCSYEVSNLGAFIPISAINKKVSISKMFFAQPANVVSAPLVFNIVSVAGGDLVCAVTWQVGALDVPESDENIFVDKICKSMRSDLVDLCCASNIKAGV